MKQSEEKSRHGKLPPGLIERRFLRSMPLGTAIWQSSKARRERRRERFATWKHVRNAKATARDRHFVWVTWRRRVGKESENWTDRGTLATPITELFEYLPAILSRQRGRWKMERHHLAFFLARTPPPCSRIALEWLLHPPTVLDPLYLPATFRTPFVFSIPRADGIIPIVACQRLKSQSSAGLLRRSRAVHVLCHFFFAEYKNV